MEEDQNVYLCILAKAYMQTKFTIQFDSDEEIIKLLSYDSFEHISLKPNEPKLFQLESRERYELKFTRERAYYYIKITVCKNDADSEDFQTCLEDLKSGDDRGKQLPAKTEESAEQPCVSCIVFIRLEAEEDAEAILHVQSQYSMIQLKEKDVVADFLNENEENRYSLTAMKD